MSKAKIVCDIYSKPSCCWSCRNVCRVSIYVHLRCQCSVTGYSHSSLICCHSGDLLNTCEKKEDLWHSVIEVGCGLWAVSTLFPVSTAAQSLLLSISCSSYYPTLYSSSVSNNQRSSEVPVSMKKDVSLLWSLPTCICIYIHTYTHIFIYIHIHLYLYTVHINI